jgi:class 3 adenylate cyclase
MTVPVVYTGLTKGQALQSFPSGTVTFLFTDVEGSTELARKLGGRYANLLSENRQLLRAAFAEHDGHEIDTQGDSFFVAFERARDAVLAAVDAQRSLAEHASQPSPRIRMGLHTTEPHLWEEGYVGVGLTRANRICAAGHGGQVLLSRSTAGLVADEDLEGVRLLDLGDHRLKGLDDAERIFQLVIDGLESDFPPLDTIEGAGLATETLTILVTDLEGATALLHRLPPDEFRRLIADYHQTLERVLVGTSGTAIVSFGDTATAVYRSARQAVVAAATPQRSLAERAWRRDLPIRVNVALDSGEVVATGHGYFGEAVNRCAYLCDHSRGGQVSLSEATRNLLEGEDLGELELMPVDERPLARGGRPLGIYQLIVPELPSSAESRV